MTRIIHSIAGLGAAALMVLAPATGFADTPLGMYQTADRLEDYDARLCGQDDKFLCIKLLALRGNARSERGNKLIGTDVLYMAQPAGPNRWKGKITIEDKTADSQVVVNKGVSLDVHACAYIVLCASISLPVAERK
jgi:hypothetical protein